MVFTPSAGRPFLRAIKHLCEVGGYSKGLLRIGKDGKRERVSN